MAVLIGCLLLTGCSKPRTIEDVEEEMRSLPATYLTAETGKEISAPSNKGVFVDEETGELCFPAYMCTNPDCPGEKQGDRPFLFIHRRMLLEAGPNGEVIYNEIPEGKDPTKYITSRGGFMNPTCPACYKKRNPDSESAAEKQKYIKWAKPYEAPEVVQRRAELEEEFQALYKPK